MGTARNPRSRVWFTISHGILNEIYYPRVDTACTRDMEMLVTDGKDFFSEEKRDATSHTSWMAPGVPAFEVVNKCKQGRYEIQKHILADPRRHAILQQTRFTAKTGTLDNYHLYVLLAPHLHNFGEGNTAWVGDYNGIPMLMAERDGTGLALACSVPWLKRSAGFVGISDGWQDLHAHKNMEWEYGCARDGNVALTGEIAIKDCNGTFLLVLGFGRTATEAGHRARAALLHSFEPAWQEYRQEWQKWQESLQSLESVSHGQRNLYRISTAVIGTHEATDFPGGTIASLSIPWGTVHGENDIGGYHLVWPRDAYEACGAMLACGAEEEARRALEYFEITQQADGHWPQNMWLDGTEYWAGTQIDETAAPILLLDMARRENLARTDVDRERLWPMVRKAISFIIKHGPATGEDRWEENPGYSPFTLGTEIAALLIAAELAEAHHEPELARYLRETADTWNDSIEDWVYCTGTNLAKEAGVDGYYVRITPIPLGYADSQDPPTVRVKNVQWRTSAIPASQLVSPDALALVRFGLRAPDDPRILNTIKVIDKMLKVETPHGPAWHRYNHDGYGEHADGSPFDGTGIGRAWPLLTGERAHYELAAGRIEEARRLLRAMEAFADQDGMISEQVWDTKDIPERELFLGRPSGSARPLVWAHAEYIKLVRSLKDGLVFDMPPQTVERYIKRKTSSPYAIWRFTNATPWIRQGRKLRIETRVPARVHWTTNGWEDTKDTPTRDTGLGMHVVDLPTESLAEGSQIIFTFYWPEAGHWEGRDFTVQVIRAEAGISRAANQEKYESV